MGLLFGSKAEKVMSKAKKKGIELELSYAEGCQIHKGAVFRYDPKKFIVYGFTEALRDQTLAVRIPSLDVYFQTRVTHMTHDVRGRVLFYCDMPAEVESLKAQPAESHYFVYPKAVAVLAISEEETFLDDMKSLKMYIWDVSRSSVALVNRGKHQFETGYRFLAAKLTLGHVEVLVDLEVDQLREKELGRDRVQIMNCRYVSEIKELEAWVDICRKIDRL